MSGHSDSQDCPRCNGKESLMTYTDWKPCNTASGECLECGWQYWTQEGELTLEDLNELRKDFNKKPLKKLPKSAGKKLWE